MPRPPENFRHRLVRAFEHYFGVHIYRIRRRPLDTTLPLDAKVPGHLTIRQASPDELWKATKDPELVITEEFLTHALARGDKAFAAFDGTRIVAYTWRSFGGAPHEGLRIYIRATIYLFLQGVNPTFLPWNAAQYYSQ